MIILGIDPGTATTGFGLVERNKNRDFCVIDYGCIITEPGVSAGERLQKIHNELTKIIKTHKPDLISVEALYFFKNLKTAMPVSQARGVILLAAAENKIPVFDVTPLQAKMAITGYGKAEKKQMQKMVKIILHLEEKPKDKNKRKDDATDALGIAICGGLKNFAL
jgi:crossover junction endodeoxyribonuclease RuvC